MRELALEWEVLVGEVRAGAMARLNEAAPGFMFGAWNRRDGVHAVGFSAICGQGGSPVLNNAHLIVHSDGAATGRQWALLASDMLTTLVETWAPDWGFYASGSVRDRQRDRRGRSPVAGYLTYLSSGRRAFLPSRPQAHVTAGPDGGVLLSQIEPDGSMRKPDDVLRLAKKLTRSGAFAPTPEDRPTLGSRPDGAAGSATTPAASAGRKPAPDVIRLKLKHEPTPENAGAFAVDVAAAALDITGVKLDYSRESLREVDAIIEDLRSNGPPLEQFRETLFGFGCYVGEVMVRQAGGRWDTPLSDEERRFLGWPLLVRFCDGHCANPIHKVMRRYDEGQRMTSPSSTTCWSGLRPSKHWAELSVGMR